MELGCSPHAKWFQEQTFAHDQGDQGFEEEKQIRKEVQKQLRN